MIHEAPADLLVTCSSCTRKIRYTGPWTADEIARALVNEGWTASPDGVHHACPKCESASRATGPTEAA